VPWISHRSDVGHVFKFLRCQTMCCIKYVDLCEICLSSSCVRFDDPFYRNIFEIQYEFHERGKMEAKYSPVIFSADPTVHNFYRNHASNFIN
jgi:hypothetical protein